MQQDEEHQPYQPPRPVPPRPPGPPGTQQQQVSRGLLDDDPEHRIILVLGKDSGIKITLEFATLCAGFLLTVLVLIGCFWIILAPTGQDATVAAFSLLSGLVAAWVATVSNRGTRKG